MIPTLPSADPLPSARAAALAAQADAYAFERDATGTLYVKSVPPADRYDARYLAAAAVVAAELTANRLAQPTRAWPPRTDGDAPRGPAALVDALGRRVEAATQHLPARRPTDPSGYDDLVAVPPRPLAFGRCDDDAFFAWRQVAGATPVSLRALDALPDGVRLDGAPAACADAVRAALADGGLFACDYGVLEGMRGGEAEGMAKHVYAPVALFARGASGELAPVAIQVTRGDPRALRTPADGLAWRLAKAVVNNAEMTLNGVVAHFSLCHLMAESLVCVSRRALAPAHPLMHLLAPHFRYTLAANATARESIVNPGGKQEYLLGPRLDDNYALVDRVNAALRYDRVGARDDLRLRGVDDPARLPVYPYRDDALPLVDALDAWALDYLRVYYPDDAAAAGDVELRAWADALSRDARFRGVPAVDTVAGLARFVADLLWRLTGYHAVVNYGGWDWFGWAPGTPSALFAPMPEGEATDADWRAMLPPLSVANGMLEQMRSLHEIQLDRLGDYPDGHFVDPRVAAPLARLQTRLRDVAAATAARDATRPWSFPWLHPERVPASIHV